MQKLGSFNNFPSLYYDEQTILGANMNGCTPIKITNNNRSKCYKM